MAGVTPQAKRAFKLWDKDRSGSISGPELVKALSATGVKVNAAEAQDVMAKYDVDGDGSLGLVEFSKLVDELSLINSERISGSTVSTKKLLTQMPAVVETPGGASAASVVKLETPSVATPDEEERIYVAKWQSHVERAMTDALRETLRSQPSDPVAHLAAVLAALPPCTTPGK
jgi:hypothetical protein